MYTVPLEWRRVAECIQYPRMEKSRRKYNVDSVIRACLAARTVKSLLAVQEETPVRSLDQEDPLEQGMVPTPVLLPGPGGPQSMGSQRVRHN